MNNRKLYLLLATALLLSGCNLIYKQSVQQGNAIEQESVDDLTLGMTKRQVSLIMGTPAIHDPFHVDRWDYIYTFRPRNNDGSQRNISLYFEDDTLTKIDDKGFRNTGDDSPIITPEPEEAELAAASEVVSEPAAPATEVLEQPEVPEQPVAVIDKVEEVNVTEQEFDVTSVPTTDYFTVQLGNFTDIENAEALKAIIEDARHDAVIEIMTDQVPVRYRVLSGQRLDQAGAEELVETLNNDTGHYGFVVSIGESPD